MNKGFSVVELVIVVSVIGMISVIVISEVNGAVGAASTVKCLGDLEAFATEVDSIAPTGPPPSQQQVSEHIDWAGKYEDYWYLPNNRDFNQGHGNDLDGCDEDNPGRSSKGRTCIQMRFVIVCSHLTHGKSSDAKYCFKADGMPPLIVPYEDARHIYLQDAKWYPGKDPGFENWIGETARDGTGHIEDSDTNPHPIFHRSKEGQS